MPIPGSDDTVAPPARASPARRRNAYVVTGWCALIGGCLLAGAVLKARGQLPIDDLPPLHAELRRALLTWQLLPAIGYAAAAIALLPRLARTLRWGRLLLLGWLGTATWACLLAVSDGPTWLAEPFTHKSEYVATAEAIGGDPIGWLRGFTDNVGSYPTHVAGHPPLPVLLFWVPHALGLPTGPSAAALSILLGSSASAAALVTARRLLGEDPSRAAAPYLVLTPYVLTIATSADAMFLGITAWGIALFTIASVRHSVALGGVAGLLLGTTPFLSYGLLPLGAVVLAVVWLRPSRFAVLGALAGALGVFCAFTAAGFWWPDGVLATHERWASGLGSDRPYWYILVANFAIFAMITGPATACGLAAARGRRLRILVGSALLALLVLDVSGVTRLEVERIWIPFAPWVMLATSTLPATVIRGWLVAQVAVAAVIQGTVGLVW